MSRRTRGEIHKSPSNGRIGLGFRFLTRGKRLGTSRVFNKPGVRVGNGSGS